MKKFILTFCTVSGLIFSQCTSPIEHNTGIKGKLHFEIINLKNEDTVRSGCTKNFILWQTFTNTTREKIYFYQPTLISQREINGKYQDDYQWLNDGFEVGNHCTFPLTEEVKRWKSEQTAAQARNPTHAFVKHILTKEVLAKLDESEKIRAGYSVESFIFLQPDEKAKFLITMPQLNAAQGKFRFFAFGSPQIALSPFDVGGDVVKKLAPLPAHFEGYRYWQGDISTDTLSISFNQYTWKRKN